MSLLDDLPGHCSQILESRTRFWWFFFTKDTQDLSVGSFPQGCQVKRLYTGQEFIEKDTKRINIGGAGFSC